MIVAVKQVPDTETKIKILNGKEIDKTNIDTIISPYDEFGVEQALLLKEAKGEGEVTVITMGPESADSVLRHCFAMGADKGIRVPYEGDMYDPALVAEGLSQALKGLPFDILFFGRQAIDDDSEQVPQQVAERLGILGVSRVVKCEVVQGGKVLVHRQIEGGSEVLEVSLPAVLSAQKGLNEPRYPSLIGIRRAKSKPIEIKPVDLPPSEIELVKLEPPPLRKEGRIIGEGKEAVPQLLRLLHEEAKII